MTVIDRRTLFTVRAARNIGHYDPEERERVLASLHPDHRAAIESSVKLIVAMKEARDAPKSR